MQRLTIFLCILFLLLSYTHDTKAQGSQYTYKTSVKLDIPLTVGSGLLWMYSTRLHNRKEVFTEDQLETLDVGRISKFDRVSCSNWSLPAHRASNAFLFGSPALPFVLLFNKNVRNHNRSFGTVGLLTFETLALNNALTGLTKEIFKRQRPLLYNPECPLDMKLSRNATSSFISGHTSNVAAMSFMTAQIYSDLNPNSKGKVFIWGTAAAIPAITALLRVKAGRHFPTDVMVGYLVGAAVGILVPRLHRQTVE
ncbi:MAG: phosphatase PAP2 family protein [Chitinophagales bacterium]